MDLTQIMVEIYVGNSLSGRQTLFMPVIMAVQQAVEICLSVYEAKEPIKVVFTNGDNDKIEYKNNAYIKFEEG